MADDFGLKIGIEGEKDFKKALSDINQSFKVLGSEMTLVTSQFDKNDKSAQALASRNEILNKEIDAQRDKITTLKAALDNAASSFGENDRRTQNWQVQLNKAQAELNGMERELSGNEKALAVTGSEFQEGAKDADKFGDEVQDSGKQADDAGGRFEKLGGVLKGVGAAMGAAFVAVGAAAVGAAKSLTDMTVGASEYADNILTMSSVTGMSTDSLQAYQYAAELVDTSLDTLTGSKAPTAAPPRPCSPFGFSAVTARLHPAFGRKRKFSPPEKSVVSGTLFPKLAQGNPRLSRFRGRQPFQPLKGRIRKNLHRQGGRAVGREKLEATGIQQQGETGDPAGGAVPGGKAPSISGSQFGMAAPAAIQCDQAAQRIDPQAQNRVAADQPPLGLRQ